MNRSQLFDLIEDTLSVMARSTSHLLLSVYGRHQNNWPSYDIERNPSENTFDLLDQDTDVLLATAPAINLMDELRARFPRNVQIEAILLCGPYTPPQDDPPFLVLYERVRAPRVPLSQPRTRACNASDEFELFPMRPRRRI